MFIVFISFFFFFLVRKITVQKKKTKTGRKQKNQPLGKKGFLSQMTQESLQSRTQCRKVSSASPHLPQVAELVICLCWSKDKVGTASWQANQMKNLNFSGTCNFQIQDQEKWLVPWGREATFSEENASFVVTPNKSIINRTIEICMKTINRVRDWLQKRSVKSFSALAGEG